MKKIVYLPCILQCFCEFQWVSEIRTCLDRTPRLVYGHFGPSLDRLYNTKIIVLYIKWSSLVASLLDCCMKSELPRVWYSDKFGFWTSCFQKLTVFSFRWTLKNCYKSTNFADEVNNLDLFKDFAQVFFHFIE